MEKILIQNFKIKDTKCMVTKGCGSGHCPTYYEDANGNVLIQGYKISEDEKKELHLSSNEEVIYLPKEVFDEMFGR